MNFRFIICAKNENKFSLSNFNFNRYSIYQENEIWIHKFPRVMKDTEKNNLSPRSLFEFMYISKIISFEKPYEPQVHFSDRMFDIRHQNLAI